MAINRYGKEVRQQRLTGTYDGTDLSVADSNEGLVAKLKTPNADWQDGIGKYEKTGASTDNFAGVIGEVAGADITSTSSPALDPHGTVPGGNSVTIYTQGVFLLKCSRAVTGADAGSQLTPDANGEVTPATSGNNLFGRVLAADPNPNNLLLVQI